MSGTGTPITARCGSPGSYDLIKVRLSGIDAPEKKQPFGQRAKEAMSRPVFGKTQALDRHKVDPYRRSVCKVSVNGRDVGLEMIRHGMAWWYRAYANHGRSVEL
ncbi:thermonuclease family protein [Variovorax dokdonensis]|uniref:thermonuclease family protein n=1 Tax=Variovorax dokdonensis TaxID=344883 RepID=UPI0034A3C6B5